MATTARADTVGSLLRPAEVVQARNDQLAGKISAADRRAVEDRAVLDAIALQTSAGLDVISDGEMRRASWNAAIGVNSEAPFGGYEMVDATHPIWRSFWRGADRQRQDRPAAAATMVTSKLSVARDIVSEEYGFLRRTRRRAPSTPSRRPATTAPSGTRSTPRRLRHGRRLPACRVRLHPPRGRRQARRHGLRLHPARCAQLRPDLHGPGRARRLRGQGHDLEAEVVADAEIDNALFDGLPAASRGPSTSVAATGRGGYLVGDRRLRALRRGDVPAPHQLRHAAAGVRHGPRRRLRAAAARPRRHHRGAGPADDEDGALETASTSKDASARRRATCRWSAWR